MALACIAAKTQKHPLEIGILILSILIFSTLGATLGPYRTSITIMGLLLIYILLQGASTPLRLIPLVAAASTHIAAVLAYYSNPLILPLVILERSTIHGYSINIDIVQIALLYEARQILKNPPICREEEPEDTKTPPEDTLEPGDQAPR
ncbi:MAG: hypothetical protein F7C08_02055 [Desulfurococcales archaeon]|nr:hypothetical protein [Desulfurococcales archaeon]MCE4605302.1 hypothetical protein [Desulfurococcales archaeon]